MDEDAVGGVRGPVDGVEQLGGIEHAVVNGDHLDVVPGDGAGLAGLHPPLDAQIVLAILPAPLAIQREVLVGVVTRVSIGSTITGGHHQTTDEQGESHPASILREVSTPPDQPRAW
jgi:hypothetical protein